MSLEIDTIDRILDTDQTNDKNYLIANISHIDTHSPSYVIVRPRS